MAKMFSDLQGSVRLLLHLRSKEIRKSDGCVWRLGRNGNWSYDTAEVRTRKSKVAATVTFTESIWRWRMITFSRTQKNKQSFLLMLSETLQNVGCVTHYPNGEADLLIVKTAVESTRTNTTVLVRDDTFASPSVLSCFRRWLWPLF